MAGRPFRCCERWPAVQMPSAGRNGRKPAGSACVQCRTARPRHGRFLHLNEPSPACRACGARGAAALTVGALGGLTVGAVPVGPIRCERSQAVPSPGPPPRLPAAPAPQSTGYVHGYIQQSARGRRKAEFCSECPDSAIWALDFGAERPSKVNSGDIETYLFLISVVSRRGCAQGSVTEVLGAICSGGGGMCPALKFYPRFPSERCRCPKRLLSEMRHRGKDC